MKTFIILIIFTFILSSCEYECPGFPESELGWIPYKQGDTLRYSSGGDTIVFAVNHFERDLPSSSTGLYMDYECRDMAEYSTGKVKYDYKIHERCYGGDNMEIYLDDSVEGFKFYLGSKSDSTYSGKVVFYTDTIINGKSYTEVYVAYPLGDMGAPRFAYLIKAGNYGIIEFYDNVQAKKWNLVR